MNWLTKTIEKHNNKLTYTDHEEHWTVGGWVCSLISLTSLSTLPLVTMAVQDCNPLAGVVGSCLGAFSVWWHFWHILN